MTPALPQSETPDFRHVDVWIFDLDNTLYPASSDLFAQIDARMRSFIAGLFGVDEDEARRIQKTYYREHGTTLNGLMTAHGLDPEPYLAYVHDIDLSVLAADPRLAAALQRLPGRRVIFTNGCRAHAERVAKRLGIFELFDAVADIRTARFSPKPDRAAYAHVLEAFAIDPRRAAMFEDIARNLAEPAALGMTTVLLANDSPWSRQGPAEPPARDTYVHYATADLADFLSTIRVRSTP